MVAPALRADALPTRSGIRIFSDNCHERPSRPNPSGDDLPTAVGRSFVITCPPRRRAQRGASTFMRRVLSSASAAYLLLLWMGALTLPVRAETVASGGNTAIAQALFQEARAKLSAATNAESVEAACALFVESERLDPAPGTLLNLAVCHERQGRTATAWAEYQDVIAQSRRERNPERERIAQDRIAVLEPRLCRISLVLPSSDASAGVEIRLDAVPLGREAAALAIPIDPGLHVLEVWAPGRRPWSRAIGPFENEGETQLIEVPALERDVALTAVAQPPPPAGRASGDVALGGHPPQAEAAPASGRRLGYAFAATSLLALGSTAYFGVEARTNWNLRNHHCLGGSCDQSAVEAGRRAQTFAWLANGSAAVGILAAGVAAYELLVLPARVGTSPTKSSPAVKTSVSPIVDLISAPASGGATLSAAWSF